jgi:hypothetical protein
MGGSSSKEVAPPPPPQVQYSPEQIASLLSQQSAAQTLAAQTIQNLSAQASAAPKVVEVSAPLWSSFKFWGIILLVIGIVVGLLYGASYAYASATGNQNVIDWLEGKTVKQAFTNMGGGQGSLRSPHPPPSPPFEEFSNKDSSKTSKQGGKGEATNGSFPLSFNAPSGLEFTYVWWTVVTDWAYKMGKPKYLWVKGDLNKGEQAPSVALSPSENSMQINMDTFKGVDTITIPNLPARKWFHTAIMVHDENIMDVYINGQLKMSHKLNGIVKQNNSNIKFGVDGGFEGYLSTMKYYNYKLDEGTLQGLVQQNPQVEVPPSTYPNVSFASNWF